MRQTFVSLAFLSSLFVLILNIRRVYISLDDDDGRMQLRRRLFAEGANHNSTNNDSKNNNGKAKRIALARTFCEADAMDLAASFDVWDKFLPCREKPEIPVDVIISFSQTLDDNVVAKQATQAAEKKFREARGWNGCFDKFVVIDTKLPPSMDFYKPSLQQTNVNWVNGPNRQFERTIRKIMGLGDAETEYELMYLMEGDSVPLKSYWLDAFTSEISDMRPFAILGSSYKGDKWDQFFNQLPSSLIHHTNGNALYNLTSPLFLNLLSELESEANTPANSIAFDHRMQQIIQEGVIGIPCKQDEFPQPTDPMKNRTRVFQEWVEQYHAHDAIKESLVNGNYAATNMVRELVSDNYYVIHGAKMYKSWNSTAHGDITLVVSDWTEQNSRQILASLKESKHPFTKVLTVQPDEIPPVEVEGMPSTITHTVHHRGNDPDFMDFCTAPITSEWFMITNSYFTLRPIVTVMVKEKGDGRFLPVVSTVEADNMTCFSHKSCVQDMDIARQFLPKANMVFQSDNLLFKTSIRNEFCSQLQLLPVSSSLTATPASAYMAFAEAEMGGIESTYKLSDRRKDGSRFAFVPIHADLLPPIMANQHRRNRQLQSVGSNETQCNSLTTEEECQDLGCIWRLDFESCHEQPEADDALEEVADVIDNSTVAKAINQTLVEEFETLAKNFDGNFTEFLLDIFGNFSKSGNVSAVFPNFNSGFKGDLMQFIGNTTNLVKLFGSAKNFATFFGLDQSGKTKVTEPPIPEAEVVEGPKMCTIQVVLGGDTVDTMEIPCP